MQGLVDFASQIGEVFAVLLPTFAYLAALGCFLFAAWGFWMQAQPHNRPRPSMDTVSIARTGGRVRELRQDPLHGARLGGISLLASITSLSSYSPPSVSDASSLMGSTQRDARNVVTLFQGFFQSFGAMCAFFALLSWRAVINGHANRSQMGCVVQFVFGIMLINILAITNALIAMFVA